jgi:hypothetical protein
MVTCGGCRQITAPLAVAVGSAGTATDWATAMGMSGDELVAWCLRVGMVERDVNGLFVVPPMHDADLREAWIHLTRKQREAEVVADADAIGGHVH